MMRKQERDGERWGTPPATSTIASAAIITAIQMEGKGDRSAANFKNKKFMLLFY